MWDTWVLKILEEWSYCLNIISEQQLFSLTRAEDCSLHAYHFTVRYSANTTQILTNNFKYLIRAHPGKVSGWVYSGCSKL